MPLKAIPAHPYIRYASLSSSSRYGNAYLVGAGETHVLIDYGVPLRRLESNLAQLSCDPDTVAGILITHEHGDHSRALRIKHPFHVRYQIPVYATPGTWRALGIAPDGVLHRALGFQDPIRFGGLAVDFLKKKHDAVEPAAVRVRGPRDSIAVVTDLGEPTRGLLNGLRGMSHFVIESNYDTALQRDSGRPDALIRRVMGPLGHLSNAQAGGLLQHLGADRLESVLLAHLSLDCNEPGLAIERAMHGLSETGFRGRLRAAPADEATEWITTRTTQVSTRAPIPDSVPAEGEGNASQQ